MRFRVIDEPPHAAPLPGVPRLLLAFVALSLLVHALLLVRAESPDAAPAMPIGMPYIRAILSNDTSDRAREDAADGSHGGHKSEPVQKHEKTSHPASPNDKKTPIEPDQVARPSSPAESPVPAAEPLAAPEPAQATAAAAPVTPSREGETSKAAGMAGPTAEPAAEATTEASREGALARRNYLLGQLQDQLSRYLSYPLRARRRGWEGEVLLGLRLAADGRLHDIQLLRSSGHALLDRSALRALSRIERLQLPAEASRLRPTQLQLPVVYRLSES